MTDDELDLLLAQALASTLGIVVSSSDPNKLRTRLYNIRKRQPSYSILSFALSPTNPETELVILKNV